MAKLATIKPLISRMVPALAVSWDIDKSEPAHKQSGRGGRPWRRKREVALRRDQYLCQHCAKAGRVTAAQEVHHIIGVAEGGDDDEANLISLCIPCHDDVERAKQRQGFRP